VRARDPDCQAKSGYLLRDVRLPTFQGSRHIHNRAALGSQFTQSRPILLAPLAHRIWMRFSVLIHNGE
jgi:hypothetical protein